MSILMSRSSYPSRDVPRKLCWFPAIALALLSLSSCNLVTRDAGADQVARIIFEEASRHETEAFKSRLDPALQDAKAQSQIADVERLIPAGEPRKRSAINTTTFTSARGTTVLASDQYDYKDRSALVQTRLYRAPNTRDWSVQGFDVQVETFKQLKANDFSLTGKSAAQYAFLAFLVTSPLLIAAALVKVLRMAGLRRKWLWCAVSVLGLGQLRMNWATGVVALNPVSVQLFGAGFSRALSSFAPWILTVALPIGAVLILTGIGANPARARKPSTAS